MRSKCILSEDCESDHMSLLRAFQSWQASGNGEEFCSDYNLSQVSHFRAVARGWAGLAMAHPVFRGFKGKTCKIIHFKYTFCLLAHPVSNCYLQLW